MGTDYPSKKLGDVADFVRGITFKPDDVIGMDTANAVACMRTKNVQIDLDLSDVWGVPASFVKRNEQYLREGDILVSSANSWNLVGKCSWVPKLPYRATIGGFISCLRRTSQNLDERYLFHWFSSGPVQALVRNCARKTTNISNLSFEQCLALEIPLPPLEEQKRIAAILDQADDIRRKRQHAIDRLNQLGQAIFHDMFGDPLVSSKNGEMVILDDVISKITNGYVGPTRDIYVDQGVPYLLAKHIKNQTISFDSKTFVTPAFCQKHKKSRLEQGDVLVVQSGHIGTSAVVSEDHVGSNCHALIILSPLMERLDPYFLSYMFGMPPLKAKFESIRTGQTLPHLNCRDVKEIKFNLPDLKKQKDFLSFIKGTSEKMVVFRHFHVASERLFASLQHRAFAGEL